MVGSRDLEPSTDSFGKVFYHNQFVAKPKWPSQTTNLSDEIAIVTGSNTGLGLEASRQLLGLRLSHLIMAVRSLDKGEVAARELREMYPRAEISVWQLDMGSYESIQSFATRVVTQLSRIDIVILNAGVLPLSFRRIESTGHGEVLQINYLSTILLAILLLPTLKAKGPPDGPAHLSIVNAALTLAATFPEKEFIPLLPAFDDPNKFDSQQTYNSSKLLAHMFLWKLVDYVSADDVIVNLADPAWCKGTELAREVKGGAKIGLKIFALAGRTPRVGASCFVDAVVNKGKESHGCFLMSWRIHP